MTVIPIFVLLCGVGFCSFVSYNLVSMPALAPFAETLGAGPVTVGFIVAAISYTGAFTIIGCLQLMTAAGFWVATGRQFGRL